MTPDFNLGAGALSVIALYLLALVGIGIAGRRSSKENSLDDFYLGGRGMGFLVLLLTLYATQYSGNTLIGFAGRAYREGFLFLMSVTFMMAVIAVFVAYAPRLRTLAERHRFLTVGDYVQQRYGSTTLTVLVSGLSIFALGNYILTNLKAMGSIVEIVSGGAIPFAYGIIGLSLIMVVYETLGGMRSVAWTDVLQGVILLAGCVAILFAVEYLYETRGGTAAAIHSARPDLWDAPTGAQKVSWLSTLILLGIGIAMYPHAIQRIFAAGSSRALKRSLQWMAVLPLVTTLFMVYVGIVGNAHFPDLSRLESDNITLMMLGELTRAFAGMEWLVVLFICAATAAIMSTIDSALLAISSLFTQDMFRRLRPASNQSDLTRVGKIVSWLIMAAMAWLAIESRETIWRLLEIKLEILCQIAPAVILGINRAALGKRAVLGGILAGLLATCVLMFGGDGQWNKPLGVHAGVWGLAINLLVLTLIQSTTGRRATQVQVGG